MASRHGLLVRATYRALLREARRLDRAGERVTLHRPVDITRWGQGAPVAADDDPAALQRELFPGVEFAAAGYGAAAELDGLAVRRVAAHNMRAGGGGGASAAAAPPTAAVVDGALRHLATVNRLRAADGCRSVTRTRFRDAVVDVELATVFVPAMPPEELARAGAFPFAYRVRVVNRGAVPVQLLGRHWVFTDERGGTTEVPRNSPGVVGHVPLLQPHEAFEYVSGTQLATPSGRMEGSFQMVRAPSALGDSGEMFDAVIACTPLRGPAGDLETLLGDAGREGEVAATHR